MEADMAPRSTIHIGLFLAFAMLSAGCGKPQVKYAQADKTAVAGQATEWTFDKDAAGKPPAGSEVFGGTWEVRAEADAPSKPHALGQTATGEDFPAIRLGNTIYTDLLA